MLKSLALTPKRLHHVFGISATALCAAILFWPAPFGRYGGDQARNIELGLWSLRFLMATLVAGSLGRVLRRPWLNAWGQPLGLAAFGFGLVHTIQYVAYAGLWPDRLERVLRKPYLDIGLVALVLMAPLAATSAAAIVRRMGFRRWKALHRLVYPIAVLSVLHHMMAYGSPVEGWLFVGMLVVLFGERVAAWRARAALRTRAAPLSIFS